MQYSRCRYELLFLTDVNNFSRSHLSNISSLSLNFILTCYWRMLSIPALLCSSSVTCLSFSSFSFVLVVVEGRKRTFPLPGPFAASSFAAADVDNDLSRTSPASGTTLVNPLESEVRTGRARPSLCRAKQLRTSLLCRGLDASPSHRYSSLPSPVFCPFFTRVEGDDKINQW